MEWNHRRENREREKRVGVGGDPVLKFMNPLQKGLRKSAFNVGSSVITCELTNLGSELCEGETDKTTRYVFYELECYKGPGVCTDKPVLPEGAMF